MDNERNGFALMGALKTLEFIGTRVITKAPALYNIANLAISAFDDAVLKTSEVKGTPLVLVYQQGRVGSTSVYEALSSGQNKFPVFHLHTLSFDRANSIIHERRLSKSRIDRNIFLAKKVAASIERRRLMGRDSAPHKLVVIFREPIGLMISLIFMHGEKNFLKNFDGNNVSNYEKALSCIKGRLEADDPSGWAVNRWLEEILPSEIGIDPFFSDFDIHEGFGISRNKELDLCLLKFERLDTSFNKAVGSLLRIDMGHINLRHSNVHKNAKYDRLHQFVKENLELSVDFCRRAYDTRTMRHFYSEKEREALIAKWARRKR